MWRRLLECGFALAFTGCAGTAADDESSSSGSGGGSQSGSVQRTDFPDRLAVAVCGNVSGCCSEAGFGYDREICEVTLGQIYGGLLSQATESESYDAAAAGRCLDQVNADIRACSFSEFGGEECASLFASSAASAGDGEPCGQSCERTGSGTSCLIVGDPPGECYREDGLYCDTTTFTCAALIPNGEACAASDGCEAGYCSGGVCVPRVGEGEYCGFDDYACRENLVCDFATQTCAAKAAVGESCAFPDDCESDNCGNAGICLEEGTSEGDDTFLAIACGGG